MEMGKWVVLAAGLAVSLCLLTGLVTGAAETYTQELETQPVPELIALPCPVEGTELMLLELAEYEGPFYEDGSGEEVAGVCAAVIENRGGTTVYEGCVTLRDGGRELTFRLTWLPPGSKILVPEVGRKAFAQGEWISCTGWSTGIYPEYTGAVTALRLLDGISLTNHTTQTIGSVSVIYKRFDRESGMYIGGNAMSLEWTDLPPGTWMRDKPHRYERDSVRIVGILVAQG